MKTSSARACVAILSCAGIASSAHAQKDTKPPTAPQMVAASAISSSQIDLTWLASTDNVGVVEYLVERCEGAGCMTFAFLASVRATPTGGAYSNKSLNASTSYTYRVHARDAANNRSLPSSSATAVTLAADCN
jgi:chitodextrinase